MSEQQGESAERAEQQVAIGGVFTRQAGCLLVPFLPIRAAGALVVTTTRLIFDPILHYKLLTRKKEVSLNEVSGAESTGTQIGANLMEIVSFGKTLKINLKDGSSQTYRSMQADELAEAINGLVSLKTHQTRPQQAPQDHEDRSETSEQKP